ncbi:MAG: hypothetical protein JWR48_3756, partial [Mycobacterium sp.]|nr:hypothetical protein [Mycobacterium sp.]
GYTKVLGDVLRRVTVGLHPLRGGDVLGVIHLAGTPELPAVGPRCDSLERGALLHKFLLELRKRTYDPDHPNGGFIYFPSCPARCCWVWVGLVACCIATGLVTCCVATGLVTCCVAIGLGVNALDCTVELTGRNLVTGWAN